MGEAEILDVAAVMARYGLRDPRAARRAMDAAGAFKVGSKLLVHRERLEVYEAELVNARCAGAGGGAASAASPASGSRRPVRKVRPEREPLGPDWWRDATGRESVEPSSVRKGGIVNG